MEGMQARVRVRLVFHPPSILPAALQSEGLAKCWYLLPADARLVSDLADHLLADFELACPEGLRLEMDGFTLPPGQAVSLVRDEEALVVKSMVPPEEQLQLDWRGDSTTTDDDRPKLKRKTKRRKLKAAEESTGLAELKETTPTKGKKKKKRDRLEDDVPEEVVAADEPRKKKKRAREEPTEPKHKKKKRRAEEQVVETPDEEKDTESADKHQEPSTPSLGLLGVGSESEDGRKGPSRSARRKAAKRRYKRLAAAQAAEAAQALAAECAAAADPVMPPSRSEEGLPKSIKKGHVRFDDEGEGEAVCRPVEPTLVVTGSKRGREKTRKRAEPSTDWPGVIETAVDHSQAVQERVVPALLETQDEVANQEEAGGVEVVGRNPAKTTHEDLPVITGTPEVGDLLAYKIVELDAATFTPEISGWREGIVRAYDGGTGQLSLGWWPEEDVAARKRQALEEWKEAIVSGEEVEPWPAFSAPYDEDGSLEVDMGSLVECRVLKKSKKAAEAMPQSNEGSLQEEPSHGQAKATGSRLDENVPFQTRNKVENSRPDSSSREAAEGKPEGEARESAALQPSTPADANGLQVPLTVTATVASMETRHVKDTIDKPVEEHGPAKRGSGQGAVGPWEQWATIAEELKRKRMALAGASGGVNQSGAVTVIGAENGRAEKGVKKQGASPGGVGGSSVVRPRVSRMGAVGPVLALLRQQNGA